MQHEIDPASIDLRRNELELLSPRPVFQHLIRGGTIAFDFFVHDPDRLLQFIQPMLNGNVFSTGFGKGQFGKSGTTRCRGRIEWHRRGKCREDIGQIGINDTSARIDGILRESRKWVTRISSNCVLMSFKSEICFPKATMPKQVSVSRERSDSTDTVVG
jgi:hypothetical protein